MLSIDSTMSLVAMRALSQHQAASAQALERLATGERINRAKDDPSGTIAATHLGVQRVRLEEMLEGHERSEAALSAMEGGFSEVSNLLVELKAIVVRAANRDALAEGELPALEIQAQGIFDGIQVVIDGAMFDNQRIMRDGVMVDLGEPRAWPAGERWTHSDRTGEHACVRVAAHGCRLRGGGERAGEIDGDGAIGGGGDSDDPAARGEDAAGAG
jgi:hypothetical protein